MPRSLKEIKKFNVGTITGISESDIPEDSPAFSLNNDSNKEAGILDAINTDKIVAAVGASLCRFQENVSWNSEELNSVDATASNLSRIRISNVSIFKNKNEGTLKFTGIKGREESLQAFNIEPFLERVSLQTFQPAATIGVNDTFIPFATDSSEMSGSTGAFNDISGVKAGDYLSFSESGTNFYGRQNSEILQVTNVNVVENKVYIKRKCFGTLSQELNSSKEYEFYLHRITIGDSQRRTLAGTCFIGGWSRYSGNHINGNSSYITKFGTSNSRYAGRIDTSESSRTVNYSGKTITFNNMAEANDSPSHLRFYEGDIITVYENASTNNNGYRGKIIKKEGSTNVTLTLDTALPENEDESSNTVYLEANLLKNHTFQHAQSNGTQSPGASNQYKVNDWLHKACSWGAAGFPDGGDPERTFNVYGNQTSNKVSVVSSGGYWDETQPRESNLGSELVVNGNMETFPTLHATADDTFTDDSVDGNQQIDMVTEGTIANGGSKSAKCTLDGATTGWVSYNRTDYVVGKTYKAEVYMRKGGSQTFTSFQMFAANALRTETLSGEILTPTETFKKASIIFRATHTTMMINMKFIGTDTHFAFIDDFSIKEYGDASALYYPFESNDKYLRITSEYKKTTLYLENDISTTSTYLDIKFVGSAANKNAPEILAKGDIISLESSTFDANTEYMRVVSIEDNVARVVRKTFGTNPVAISASASARIYKNRNHHITQDVDSKYLKAGQRYKLTFYAKTSDADSSGAIALNINGGYFSSDGRWTPKSVNKQEGYISRKNNVSASETRWIPFVSLEKSDGDTIINDNGLDSYWRKFCLYFELPKDKLYTDLKLEVASRGKEGSSIDLDLFNLCEDTPVYAYREGLDKLSSIGKIDNKGNKDIIAYNSITNKLLALKSFSIDRDPYSQNREDSIEHSPFATKELNVSTNSLPMIPNNRELHVGFGGNESSTSPQWIGYTNRKIFGRDLTNVLYQDEDTVHTYDKITANSLSKVCVAGEHEYVKAYWNNSGGTITNNAVGTENLTDNTLRIHHTAHSMEVGNNIIIRKWGDTPNEWDGSGLWIVKLIATDYFDCIRYTTKDPDPAEEGIMATSSTSYSAPNVTVNCDANHNLSTGDNVLIFGGTADADVNTTHSVTVTDADTYTFSDTDSSSIGNDTNVVTVKEFRINYRPYHYYGCKVGEPYIYRIWPETRIDDSLAVDNEFPAGLIERSQPLSIRLNSICTYYAKESTDNTPALNGGRIYALGAYGTNSGVNEVLVVDVQLKFNEWKKFTLPEYGPSTLAFKAYKWSNERTDGDIELNKGVFGGTADESTPSIRYAGTPTDIIETKGTKETFDSDVVEGQWHVNTPYDFDTRLWVLCSPQGDNKFSDGDRFLFCGLTTEANTAGGYSIYLGDRTPPTTSIVSDEFDIGRESEEFLEGGPGASSWWDNTLWKRYMVSDWEVGEEYFDEDGNLIPASTITYDKYEGMYGPTELDSRDIADAEATVWGGTEFGSGTQLDLQSMLNFGANIGWDCGLSSGSGDFSAIEGDRVALEIPRFGLFAMADNDGDGVIDGTGIPVCNKTSLPSQITTGGTAKWMGPYGEKHRRVTSHCVGVIGGSNKSWWRNWGRICKVPDDGEYHAGNTSQIANWGVSPENIESGGWSMDAPEKINMDKFIAVCPDIHFGDMPMPHSFEINNTGNVSRNYADTGTGNYTKVKLKATHSDLGISQDTSSLQAGDPIFIADSSTPDQSDAKYGSTYIVRILSNDEILVPRAFDSDINDKIFYIMTPYLRTVDMVSNSSIYGTRGCLPQFAGVTGFAGAGDQHYHWAHDLNDPANGNCFWDRKTIANGNDFLLMGHEEKKGKVTYPGNFAKTFYQTPTRWGSDGTGNYKTILPGSIFKLSRLNYKAGVMMRPFDISENTFQDLVIGKGVSVDMPCFPDAVHRWKDGSKIHSSIGDTSEDNKFSSKLFIASDVDDESSKLYIIDLDFQFPGEGYSMPLSSRTSTSAEDLNNGFPEDVMLAGTINNYSLDEYNTGATTDYPSRDIHPSVIIPGRQEKQGDIMTSSDTDRWNLITAVSSHWRDKNAFTGLCISIMGEKGTIQTRQIVYSNSHQAGGSPAATDEIQLFLHAPLGNDVRDNSEYWIWSPEQVCISPVRLYKQKALPHGLTHPDSTTSSNALACNYGPFGTIPIYRDEEAARQSNLITSMSESGYVATITCLRAHGLSTNDEVEIVSQSSGSINYEDYNYPQSDPSYNGIYKITVTGAKTFTYTLNPALTYTSVSVSGGFNAVAGWNAHDSSTSASNPLKISSTTPIIKSMFGGLNLRALRHYSAQTADPAIDAAVSTGEARVVTTAAHLLGNGEQVTIDGTSSTYDSTYYTKDSTGSLFDIMSTESSDDDGDSVKIYTNKWELLVAETTGDGRMGMVSAGTTSWDKGNRDDNMIRYDFLTADEEDVYLQVIEDNLDAEPDSVANQDGDYFMANNEYTYKVSFIYDGYQEGPISLTQWNFKSQNSYSRLSLVIKLLQHSYRLSHICVYRRDFSADSFKLVQEISTKSGWVRDGEIYSRAISDDGSLGATYESRTLMPETLDTVKIKYGLSAEIDGYLFVGDVYHSRVDNASNQIFRSMPGQFSLFNYIYDYQVLKSRPTALANFNGRLYAFDKSNIYKINPQSLSTEDIFEGIGCLSSDSFTVTEFGMFFADKNGAYFHNGQAPVKISEQIYQSGDLDNDFYANFPNSTDNIRDFSWINIMSQPNQSLYIIYDAKSHSTLFFFDFITKKTTESVGVVYEQTIKRTYAWSYNVSRKRWDLWEVCSGSLIGKPFLEKNGKVCITIDDTIHEYRGGSSKRDYTWVSKKLTMGEDSIIKVFNKIKLNGITEDLNKGGSYIESSNRLLLLTSEGIPTSTYSTPSLSSSYQSDYKLSGTKKGNWLQIKLDSMTEPLDSIGIVYRRKSTK